MTNQNSCVFVISFKIDEMEGAKEFFSDILSTDYWPERWNCGYWSDFHGWMYIISDVVIWMAYMVIPILLIRFIMKKDGVPLSRVFILFGLFILACGFTHLVDAIIFYYPVYRFSALLRLFTAIVSVGTVIALIKYFNDALGLKTSKEYTRELNFRRQAMTELERSNKDLKHFAYAASHDLKSPIKTISSYLGYLNRKYSDSLDDKAKTMIQNTTEAAGRMQELIDDLLEYSQLGQNVNYVQVDVQEMIAGINQDLQPESEAPKFEIECDHLPIILADKTEIRRIFTNLIENGIKYQKEDAFPQIKISYSDEGKFHQFEVKDNGIGIAPENFDKIFQVFKRLHTRSDYKGTGIGLSMVAKIIETNGGRIWLTSEVGKGSTFKFTIPKSIKLTSSYEKEN